MAFTVAEMDEAERNLVEAVSRDDFFRLGLICSTELEDRGPDFVSAHKWFNLAAMLGSSPAKAYRDEIAMEMDPAEVTRAQREAREWLRGNREKLAA